MSRTPRRQRSHPVPLGQVLTAVYPGREPDDLRAIRAFLLWERAVPSRVAENVRPVRLFRETLQLNASSSVWAQECVFLEADLIERMTRLNRSLGVRKIKVRVGPLPPRPPSPAPSTLPRGPRLEALPDELARALASISDDSIRTAIAITASATLRSLMPVRTASNTTR